MTWEYVLTALLSMLFGASIVFGVARFKERRGAQFEDFDIDYNYVAMPCHHYSEEYDEYCTLESSHNSVIENGTILHKGTDHQWLQPAIDLPKAWPKPMSFINLVDPDMFEKNRRAFEAEQLASLSITREARGYNVTKDQCNNRNPDSSYPYYCVRHISHMYDLDPKVRRHGYAGVFWD